MIRAGGYSSWILKADAIRNNLEARIDYVFTQIIRDIDKSATTICVTLDRWTSKNRLPMFTINIKWLDEEFKRYQHYIEFVKIQGSHSRENLAYTVIIALKRIKSCHHLLTITGDNTSNNDTLYANLHKLLLHEYNDYLNKFPVYSKNI